MTTRNGILACDMRDTCVSTITHIDEKGFIYCAEHGADRQSWCRCRKLTPAELKRLQAGRTIASYDKKRGTNVR